MENDKEDLLQYVKGKTPYGQDIWGKLLDNPEIRNRISDGRKHFNKLREMVDALPDGGLWKDDKF